MCEGANHPQLLWELESSYSRESGRGDPGLLPAAADTVEYPPLAHYSPWKRLCNELEYLGMNIFTHPLSLCRKQLEDQCRKKKRSLIRTDDACRLRSDRKVFVAGLITATRRVRTARGDPMLFVTLEDEAGLLEATLFPKAYRRLGSLLGELGPYLFEGTVESEHGVESLDISGIERLDGSAMAQAPGDNGQER